MPSHLYREGRSGERKGKGRERKKREEGKREKGRGRKRRKEGKREKGRGRKRRKEGKKGGRKKGNIQNVVESKLIGYSSTIKMKPKINKTPTRKVLAEDLDGC